MDNFMSPFILETIEEVYEIHNPSHL